MRCAGPGKWEITLYVILHIHQYICPINRKTKPIERHSAIWGKFDGEGEGGLAEGKVGNQPSTSLNM